MQVLFRTGSWSVDVNGVLRASFHYAGQVEKQRSLVMFPFAGLTTKELLGVDGAGRSVRMTMTYYRTWDTTAASASPSSECLGWTAV